MTNLPFDPARLKACAAELVANVRELAALGWTPATSSNFSLRMDERFVAITISGRDKGRLDEADIMVVDLDGMPVGSDHRPSAETLLHTNLYKRFPDIGCVLHTHSVTQTIASRLYGPKGYVRFEDYELIKAFRGQDTHECELDLPVLPNSQHMPTLAAQADVLMDRGAIWGYLIDGHGLYAWGHDMGEARRHLEAFEFLLTCELEMRKMRK
jgi:methylthioribulose-1-phosphate dehydratase